jgi:hypothetical protein
MSQVWPDPGRCATWMGEKQKAGYIWFEALLSNFEIIK